MCFSATASFTAGAFLLCGGAIAMSLVQSPAQRPLAAIPLLFAVQQAIEGFVWLSFDWGEPATTRALGQAYAIFSHILWPAYVPLASWAAERPGPRKRLLGGCAVAGLFISAVLAWSLSFDPVVPVAAERHIEYASPQMLGPGAMLVYLIATTGSLIISSHGFIRTFGALALGAFLLAYGVYARWFISVWCFFAAWLSVILVLHLARLRGVGRAAEVSRAPERQGA